MSPAPRSRDRVPLFPLPIVLFPGEVRPLRIFETRYRAMLQDCLDHGTPFGLVLALPTSAASDEPPPQEIGTLAYITHVAQQPDETFGIQIRGGERFQLEGLCHDKPYLQGNIRLVPMLQTETDDAYGLADRARDLLQQYLQALTQASGIRFQVHNLPAKPEDLAYLTGIVLQIGPQQKYDLLTTTHLPRLLHAEINLLLRELDLMAWIIETMDSTRGFGFARDLSLN